MAVASPSSHHARRGEVMAADMNEEGFTLVEILVALALTLLMVGSVVSLVRPAVQLSAAEPDAIELQQRSRAALAALFADLRNAGAGIERGPASGSLNGFLPAV